MASGSPSCRGTAERIDARLLYHELMKRQNLTQASPGEARATLNQLFERAHAEQAAGRLSDAQATCREVLASDEGHAGAWHLLAIVALRSGDAQAAVAHLERAVVLAPTKADCRHSLGFDLKAT